MRKHNLKKNLSLSTHVVRALGDSQLDVVTGGGATAYGCPKTVTICASAIKACSQCHPG